MTELFAMGAGGTAQATSGTQQLFAFLPFIILIAVFYLFLIRPQQKRQKEHTKMVEALQKGDRVLTNSGIYGEIISIDATNVILKIADVKGDAVKIEILKSTIAGKAS